MPKTLQDFLNELPEDERHEIDVRYQILKEEYLSLQEIRKAHRLTQERMAEMLNIQQESVSKLEKRTDLLLSTLRSYIEAMGGNLKLVVEFPNRSPIVIKGLSEETI